MPTQRELTVRRELEQTDVFRRWVSERIETIHATVSAADVLQRNGVKLRYGGKRPEQIFCPFHGNTRTPAARYHPVDTTKPDHVWCFVCSKQWDCIELFKRFADFEGKFTALLRLIERDYGIVPPEVPQTLEVEPDTTELDTTLELASVCERRLKTARRAFEMRGYLVLGSVLDRLMYRVQAGSIPLPKAQETLQHVLDKIGEKERACPAD